MMNRSAELLFWVGRYIERIENHTRLIDVNYHLRHELKRNETETDCMWERLVSAIGHVQTFNKKYETTNERTIIQFLTFDKTNANSICSCVYQTRTNMRALRQLLPDDLWDITNAFYLWIKEQNLQSVMKQSPYLFYQRIREWLATFNGTADSIMVRDQEWNFLQAGKYLERTENILRILSSIYLNFLEDGTLSQDKNNYNRMIVLLKSVGGYEGFRKFHANNVTFEKVFEFMMLHPAFPRSVHSALTSLETSLQSIKQQDYNFALLSDQALDLTVKIKEILAGLHGELHGLDLLYKMLESCHQLGGSISKTFFQEEFVEA
ncbi:alpha-E domain-containing protein [Metabacillus litoralis]|uniref:alpha-E domain-containing protein n=1 Tax=Metabacillus litoralis TaxID=152268 RepID=UPI00203DAECF|nr:alpha-E domain-containing protein [Metabacillus litoralis]MCM3653222.1 alpha-E domain-containing protein [Metabacillus litoralis]